ncbi:MAG: cytochrome c biogenesis protein ResB [Gemmataceae bacterium]
MEAPKSYLRRAVQWLGSLKLAVLLMLTVATAIAAATVLEADYGRPYAQWYVYHSQWFLALLGLLGVNVFAAAAGRWPWKRHQTGFVVTHCGLLVLLVGSVQTFFGGVDGQVTLAEGQTVDGFVLPQQSQITGSWVGQPAEAPYEFSFEAGPADWREGAELDLGNVDGVGARVLRYIGQASVKEDWIEDATGVGGPAVKLKIEGPHGKGGEEHLLVDQDFGDEAFAGPVRLQLRRAAAPAMLDDFLKPPTDLGKKGLLLAYCKDHAARIPVDGAVGKTIPLADTGVAVEIVEYMANAKPDMRHQFHSVGDVPRNPLLELRVHEPGKSPLRQLAFAKSPLLNLDPVYGQSCPVKFHYLHPAATPSGTAIELLQATDGKLYCRLFADQQLFPKGIVTVGSRIPMPGKFTLSVAEHLPHARQKIAFTPVAERDNSKDKSEAAAEIEVTAAGVTQSFWLQRNHPIYGSRTMVTPKGLFSFAFGQGRAPLGFSLTLVEFRRGVNPGGDGAAEFSSVVRLEDKESGVDEERVVSMNEPLTYKGLTFYQSSFSDTGHGMKTSTFSVGCDPGRWLKYGGCLLICLGIAIMFYMRAYFFKRSAPPRGDEEGLAREAAAVEKESAVATTDPSPAPELVYSAGAEESAAAGRLSVPQSAEAR